MSPNLYYLKKFLLLPLALLVAAVGLPGCGKFFGKGTKVVGVEMKPGQQTTPPTGQPQPGQSFPGGPAGPGAPGTPGWGGKPGGPGQGFDPQRPSPGLGNDGELLQDEFYDPEVGVKFRCLAKKCFVQRFLEKESGQTARFGLKVFSETGLASGTEFLRIARVFRHQGRAIGHVAGAELLNYVSGKFPSQKWTDQTKIREHEGAYTRYKNGDTHLEEFYAADEQSGLLHLLFSLPKEQQDDAYLAYFILESFVGDLKSPEVEELSFDRTQIVPGETATLVLKATDDLTGIDLKWLYQENPERILKDIDPSQLYSWIGFDQPHDPATYSSAYAMPLVNRTGERRWQAHQSQSGIFEYKLPLPELTPAGKLVLAGLLVRDVYGHETRLTLELDRTGAYDTKYRLVRGRAADSLLGNPPSLFVLTHPQLQADTDAPKLLRAAFSAQKVARESREQCFAVTHADRTPLRRMAWKFTLAGAPYSLPESCLAEEGALFSRNGTELKACFALSGCFDKAGKSLVPTGQELQVSELALFDEVGNRSSFKKSDGANLPSFEFQ